MKTYIVILKTYLPCKPRGCDLSDGDVWNHHQCHGLVKQEHSKILLPVMQTNNERKHQIVANNNIHFFIKQTSIGKRKTLMVFKSIISNFAFFWIVLRMYWIAYFTCNIGNKLHLLCILLKICNVIYQKFDIHWNSLTVNFGRRNLYVSTSSIIKSTKSEKGLSKTIPAIEGSSAAYIRLQEITLSSVRA